MKKARRDARLTQTLIAPKVGVKQPMISLFENAKATPSVAELIRFALACNKRPEELLAGIVTPTVEQLHFELDPQASSVVTELVQLLHDRRPRGEAPLEDEKVTS